MNTEATLLEVLEYDLQEAICQTRSRREKAEIAIAVKKSWGSKDNEKKIVATALENDCDIFVTNDKRLKKLEVYGLTVIVLKDFVELP